jgi:hypothetical protein
LKGQYGSITDFWSSVDDGSVVGYVFVAGSEMGSEMEEIIKQGDRSERTVREKESHEEKGETEAPKSPGMERFNTGYHPLYACFRTLT